MLVAETPSLWLFSCKKIEKCENSEKMKLSLDKIEYFFQKTRGVAAEITNF